MTRELKSTRAILLRVLRHFLASVLTITTSMKSVKEQYCFTKVGNR
jgi:hypothetical protein